MIISRKKQGNYSLVAKLKSTFNTPSMKVIVCLLLASLLLISLPFFFGKEINIADILQNIGYNLLGAVCAFIVFDIVYIRLQELDKQKGVKLDLLEKYDFINKIRNLKPVNPQSIVTVRILETWTDLLSNRIYKDDFSDALISCIKNNNCHIEILLLNPENKDLVNARYEDLKTLSEQFSSINIVEENIYLNFQEIQQIIKELEIIGKGDRLKVKCYNSIPSLAIYMCMPYLFVTFFRSGKMTSMSEQLKLHIESPVGTFINQRFQEIWDDIKTIDLDDCLYMTLDVMQSGDLKSTYEKVKYISYEEGYYIQHPKLFIDITNITGISIRMYDDNIFKPMVVSMDDLSPIVQRLFLSKYINYDNLFIFLEKIS